MEENEFKLVGLNRSGTFTCANWGKEDIFWIQNTWEADRFLALFDWAKSDDTFWKNTWAIKVEHQGFFEDMTPRNPRALEVYQK